MCNYDITEMPDQNVSLQSETVLTEQVFSEDRNAKIALLEEKAQAADIAAKAVLEAKKKRKRIVEAFQAKKRQDRKNQKKR